MEPSTTAVGLHQQQADIRAALSQSLGPTRSRIFGLTSPVSQSFKSKAYRLAMKCRREKTGRFYKIRCAEHSISRPLKKTTYSRIQASYQKTTNS
jgi:hypothetical protein